MLAHQYCEILWNFKMFLVNPHYYCNYVRCNVWFCVARDPAAYVSGSCVPLSLGLVAISCMLSNIMMFNYYYCMFH